MSDNVVKVRKLGICAYESTLEKMRAFTVNRTEDTQDEIWLLEHYPVFTQGQAGKAEHILEPGDIPVVHSDRGGQVTYHGPGQLVIYLLLDIRRHMFDIRTLVDTMERSVINVLAEYDLTANARRDAPGVYIDDKKLCSLGLRVKKGCSFHGLAINVSMDLAPFDRINPCGYQGQKMGSLSEFVEMPSMNRIMEQWVNIFCSMLLITPHWKTINE